MSDVREALETAYEQLTAPEAASETPAPVETVAAAVTAERELAQPATGKDGGERETTSEAKADGRDAKGRFAQKASAAPQPAAAPALEAAPPVAPPTTVAEALKAPQAWRPQVREKWASLPPEVQAEVNRIEADVKRTLSEAAPTKKFHSDFQATVAPYEAMLRAEGVEPLKAVGNLLQTAAALRTAPPAHRAQLVANMVRTFGIPIEALDAALSGQPQQGGQQQPHLDQESLLQQAEERAFQRIQRERQQVTQQRVVSELSTFGEKHEFFDDVREDMADLLSSAARRGVSMSLADAYSRACKLHPDVSSALEQRTKAEAVKATMASTQRARAASSSIRNQPATPAPAGKPSSVNGAIEAAWEQLTGR